MSAKFLDKETNEVQNVKNRERRVAWASVKEAFAAITVKLCQGPDAEPMTAAVRPDGLTYCYGQIKVNLVYLEAFTNLPFSQLSWNLSPGRNRPPLAIKIGRAHV